MVFLGSLKGVLIKYQGCFMQVSCIGSFKGVKVVSYTFNFNFLPLPLLEEGTKEMKFLKIGHRA